jgi:hypothetical protein
MSVVLGGIVPIDVRVRMLLGQLVGGVRVISAYDGDAPYNSAYSYALFVKVLLLLDAFWLWRFRTSLMLQ